MLLAQDPGMHASPGGADLTRTHEKGTRLAAEEDFLVLGRTPPLFRSPLRRLRWLRFGGRARR